MDNLNGYCGTNPLALLQETHNEALKTNCGSYEQWIRIRNEHTTVLDFLKTLPEALTHDVLVPFGCRALMRGKLVHTNEILVRLGAGWFVKCSAKHAADICNRRLATCKDMLEKLEKEREFLLSRKELPMQQEVFGSRDQAEIIEISTEQEEADWRVQHREKERQYRQKLAEVRKREKKPLIEEEDLWQRLDELELEEELQEELDRLHAENDDFDEEDDVDYGEEVEIEEDKSNSKYISGSNDNIQEGSDTSTVHDNVLPSETVIKESVNNRGVSFPDEATDTAQDNLEVKRRRVSFSDKPLAIDSEDSEEDVRIEFAHTPNMGTTTSQCNDSNTIASPADIYNNYRHLHSTTRLKSILKKTSHLVNEDAETSYIVSNDIISVNGTEEPLEEYFSEEEVLPPVFGEVVERKLQEPPSPAPLEKRPVSRFKAARQASKR